jgi:hypothetical protein
MHLCFATPWRTSWKPICYVFLYARNTHLTFNVSLLMIFCLCYFSCYNMVAKFYCQYYVFYAHVLSTLISSLNALDHWSRLCWCMSPQKLLFCYHLPTRGRAGVKFGDAWYVSNVSITFDAPCLFIHHLLCVLLHFVAFLCISRTNLLTRFHSASSLFSAIFVFQKSYTGNILVIGQNKSQSSYFFDTRRSPKQRRRGARGQPHHAMAWATP